MMVLELKRFTFNYYFADMLTKL